MQFKEKTVIFGCKVKMAPWGQGQGHLNLSSRCPRSRTVLETPSLPNGLLWASAAPAKKDYRLVINY